MLFSENFPKFWPKRFRLIAEILKTKHKHYVKDTTHSQIRLTAEYPTCFRWLLTLSLVVAPKRAVSLKREHSCATVGLLSPSSLSTNRRPYHLATLPLQSLMENLWHDKKKIAFALFPVPPLKNITCNE